MKLTAPQWTVAVTTALLLTLALWDAVQGRTAYQYILPILAFFYCLAFVVGIIMKCVSRLYKLHRDVQELINLAAWWLFAGQLFIIFGGLGWNIFLVLPGGIMCGFSLIFLAKGIVLSVQQCQSRK